MGIVKERDGNVRRLRLDVGKVERKAFLGELDIPPGWKLAK